MFFAKSDVGRKRKINQDYYKVEEIANDLSVFIVADGLGGYESGEVASKVCAETICENIAKEYDNITENYITELLGKVIDEANCKIYKMEKTDEKYRGMGTTVLVVLKYKDKIYYVSVGDSRIYYIDSKKSTITCLTEDDTYVNTLVKTHVITEKEAQNHPQRHMLTRAIGVFESVEVDVKTLDDKEGFTLLCTDGVTNMLSDEHILNIFKEHDLKLVPDIIVQKANDNGGTDNITAVVVDISK